MASRRKRPELDLPFGWPNTYDKAVDKNWDDTAKEDPEECPDSDAEPPSSDTLDEFNDF